VDAAFATKSFHSVWKDNEAPEVGDERTPGLYVVTLDQQGGGGGTLSFQTIVHANLVANTFVAPSRHGYAFHGYFDTPAADGTRYFDGSMSGTNDWDLAADTTLYASWQARTFSYPAYSPIVYVTSGEQVNRPGVFDTITDPALDDVTFTLSPESAPLPGALKIVAGGGLVGTATTEQDSESFHVIIRATDTATGNYLEQTWTIVVLKPGASFGEASITDIKVLAIGGNSYEVTLRYLEVTNAVSQTIRGKVNLTDPGWVDLKTRGLNPAALEPTRVIIPAAAARNANGENFHFFQRWIEFAP
jgi:hypothetical protein